MTQSPIKKTILELSLPNTVGLLVIAAYSLADSFFVSRLGTAAGAAIGVVFPLPVLIQAVGYTLGLGAGSRLSRALGKRDKDAASSLAASAIVWSLILGGVICAVGLWKEEVLLRLLLAVIIGFAISAFLLFQGLSGSVNGIYIALYQLFWLIPVMFMNVHVIVPLS